MPVSVGQLNGSLNQAESLRVTIHFLEAVACELQKSNLTTVSPLVIVLSRAKKPRCSSGIARKERD
jgi:hypothetical protein